MGSPELEDCPLRSEVGMSLRFTSQIGETPGSSQAREPRSRGVLSCMGAGTDCRAAKWPANVDVVLWWGDCEDPEAPNAHGARYSIRHQVPEQRIEYDLTPDGGYRVWLDPDDNLDLATRVTADLRMLYGPHLVCRVKGDGDIRLVDLSR